MPSAVIGMDRKPVEFADRGADSPHPAGRELTDGRGMLVPHVRTFNALYNAFSRVYSSRWDEAVRHGRENAAAMLHDAFFRALLQERFKPLQRWKWEVEADPDEVPKGKGKDPYSEDREEVRRQLEAVVRRTRQLQHVKYLTGWGAGWYGRYGVQVRYDTDAVGGFPRKVVGWWEPVNGDKLHADWDGRWGVMVRPGAGIPKEYTVKTFDNVGPVLLLDRPELRQRFVVNQHEIEDADYLEALGAGRRYGVGLRDFSYWSWWLRDEMLSWLTDFMEKVGSLGLILFYYDESNPTSKANAETAAKDIRGRSALAVPRPRGNDKQTSAVEVIPANMTGVGFLKEIIADYFERHIERLFVGQSLSAGEGKSGLEGDGRAEFAKDTKFNLLASDADNQAETFTRDLILPLQGLNFREAPWRYRWKYLVPDPEADVKLDAWSKVKDVLPVKADELRETVGWSKPGEGDEVVGGPQAVPGADYPHPPGKPNPEKTGETAKPVG